MKRFFKIVTIILLSTSVASYASSIASTLKEDFKDPSDKVKTSVYWYWLAGNVSKEGVMKDLQAMKIAGINRAFIGFIGDTSVKTPYKVVSFGSEEWWNVLHTALKTAAELGIEIGIFNSPGWSQSGGPWIKSEQSMRYLASTTRKVIGGDNVVICLEKPQKEFQDVKVIAFPVESPRNVLSSGKVAFQKNLVGKPIVDLESDEMFELRSIRITPNQSIQSEVKISVLVEDGYRVISQFNISRINSALNVGFRPYAPLVISVPVTKGKKFRIEFDSIVAGNTLENIELLSYPMVEFYSEKTLAKMFQSPLPYWHEYQWRRQPNFNDSSLAISPNQVIDISKCLKGDTLRWNAPSGEWMVMRTGMLPTGVTNTPADPEATGLEVDKMSRKHVESHFDAFMGEILRRIPEADRKSWKVVVQDSYETGGQNFTDDFLYSFKKRYGYDALPFLPVFEGYVVGNKDISDRFLWDVRRLVADRIAYDYVGGLRDVSHKYGLHTWLENYGHWGFPGEFLQYGGQSDEIGGEFWSFGDLGNIENRAASSCGHIYGKKCISAESFTSAGRPFSCFPAQMKARGDRFFAEGINNTLLHLYISQPSDERVPGVNSWFGSEFNRLNTWFSQMDLFTIYLKRVNFMLQQGLNVADVAYFIGEDTPKMTGITEPELPLGYQYDFINAEVIERDLFVKDGLLTLPHGIQYRILVLPPLQTMRPELLKKVKKLIYDGAIVMGNPPIYSPSGKNYPQADEQIRKLAKELWKGWNGTDKKIIKLGKGHMLCGMNMEEALNFINCLPDIKFDRNLPIVYGHRKLKGTDIYFISNQSNDNLNFDADFRVKNWMRPELWNPVDGSIRELHEFSETKGGIRVPLKLYPQESAFIVFSKRMKNAEFFFGNRNFPEVKTVNILKGPWKMNFQDVKRGLPYTITLDSLIDLSKHKNDTIRFYSGMLTYKTNFTFYNKEEGRLYLNLNNVGVMAKVKLNKHYVGGVWTYPYRVDVTDYIVDGENIVEIEVVTTWQNRLIGDSFQEEKNRTTWAQFNNWTKQDSLQSSGLIGPITIDVE